MFYLNIAENRCAGLEEGREMGVLLDYSKDVVFFKGKKYRVNTPFDIVLLVYKLYEEPLLDASDKVRQTLRMLTKDPFKVWLLSEIEKVELLDEIMKSKIELPQRPKVGSSKKLMDFESDSDYIYASFRQAYGIDLVNERGKLPWKRFCELLDGLPDKTKLKEVMKIRAMDVPEPTKYNQKERQNIIELKSYYALPIKNREEKNELDKLFVTLERMINYK